MPAMMAIGDSLFNGVRSLTINQTLAHWSAPAQVARALGIPFAIPDYPRNVVINFEAWLNMLLWPPNIWGDLQENVNFWDRTPTSTLQAFDNIAIASASYADLLGRTAAIAQVEINGLHGQIGDVTQLGGDVATLFFAYNTRFLLNPQNNPAQANLSPMQIVTQRQPTRLLVSIGANNGLWNMGYAAEASSGQINVPPGPTPATSPPFDRNDIADMDAFVTALKALPATVQHIYVNTLPLPSMVADMMPKPDTSDTNKPGAGAYYPVYENSFGFNYGTLTAAQMALNDQTVQRANAQLIAFIAGDPRIHIVPFDQVFAQYDYKTNGAARTIAAGGQTLTNIMFVAPNPPFHQWRGGIQGLDGMHPTIVGYAVMAQAILDAIQLHEGVAAVNPIDLNAAFAADTLLSQPPGAWDGFHDLALDLRRATATPGGVTPTSPQYAPVSSLLGALRYKYD